MSKQKGSGRSQATLSFLHEVDQGCAGDQRWVLIGDFICKLLEPPNPAALLLGHHHTELLELAKDTQQLAAKVIAASGDDVKQHPAAANGISTKLHALLCKLLSQAT